MPVPGSPTVVVVRPDEWTEYRAPLTPAEIPSPVLVTLSRTPGAIFTLRRNLIAPIPRSPTETGLGNDAPPGAPARSDFALDAALQTRYCAAAMAGWIVKTDGACFKCGTLLAAGTEAVWERGVRRMRCVECPPSAYPAPLPHRPESGRAGASAQREYERLLAKREAANTEKWGDRVGGWVNRLGTVPQTTTAWAKGAHGEELLGAALGALPNVVALHDRRVAHTKGNIDHIVVGPAGVFVVDAKKLRGRIEIRNYGGWFRTDLRLTVGGRDKSSLARGFGWQMDAVATAMSNVHVVPAPPITPVLCVVDGEWPLFKPLEAFEGVRLESERSIARLLTAEQILDNDNIVRVASQLAKAFPAK
jgi:hypothetical protein